MTYREDATPPNARVLALIGAGLAVVTGLWFAGTTWLLSAVPLLNGGSAGAVVILLLAAALWCVVRPSYGVRMGVASIVLGLFALVAVNLGGFLIGTAGCLVTGVVQILAGVTSRVTTRR